jgi:hypothetical protein
MAGTHDRMVCEHLPVYLDNDVLDVCPDAWPGAFDKLHVVPPIDGVVGAHYKGVPIAKFLPADPTIVLRLYNAMFTAGVRTDSLRTSCADWRDDSIRSLSGHQYLQAQVTLPQFNQLLDDNEFLSLPAASTVGVIMPDSYQEWFHRGASPTVVRQGVSSIRWYTVCFSGVVRQPAVDYKGEKMQFVSPHGSVAQYQTWRHVR